ncbi:MAG: hypothetical protein LBT16_12940 [Treponema sp.]|jgi:hypothetical protein|nr:hypothetical protein [Treponema sp.]
MAKKGLIKAAALLLFIFFFGSCVGVSADITIRKNGSGFITLEYRISGDLESLGKLDGNARWLPVPAGRADFERTVARIPSMRIASFSSKKRDGDLVNRVTLNFGDTAALLKFLDALGQGASLSRENGRNVLVLDFGGGVGPGDSALGTTNAAPGTANAALAELAAKTLTGYSLDLRFNLGTEGEIFLVDRNGGRRGTESLPAGWIVQGGKKTAFSAPMGDLLISAEPVRLEIHWPE